MIYKKKYRELSKFGDYPKGAAPRLIKLDDFSYDNKVIGQGQYDKTHRGILKHKNQYIDVAIKKIEKYSKIKIKVIPKEIINLNM